MTDLDDTTLAGLEALRADLAAHPPTLVGRLGIRATVADALASRRRLDAVVGADIRPRVPPLVVVGWYRTGTTLLQHLLSTLPGYGHVPMHRLQWPVRRRSSRWRAALGVAAARRMVPGLFDLHPVDADGPEECWMLLATHLVVDGMAIHWTLPRFAIWLEDVDRRPAYQAWARAAGWLERDLGHGLVLKDPAHLLGLPALLEAVPDARFVWTHRDPVAAVASCAALTAVQHRAAYGVDDPHRAGRAALDAHRRYVSRGERDRGLLPADRVVDVDFDALTSDPVGTARRVADVFGLRADDGALRATLAAMPTPRGPRPPLEAWGLSESEVRAR